MRDRFCALDEAQQQYVEKVRAAVNRLGVRGAGPDPSRDALADLEDLLPLDADPPTASRNSAGRFVKAAVKRLVRWHVAYLARQVTAVGEAVLRLGSHLSDRVDEMESIVGAHAGRMEDLERRVIQLESRSADRL